MRAPTDLTSRRRRAPRGRVGLIVIAALLFLLIISLRGIAGFYTDFLWFDGLGLSSVWRRVLGAKVGLAVSFTALFFVILWLNLSIADRLAPPFRPAGPEEELVERYREVVGSHTGLVRIVVAAFFALIAGVGTSSQWNSWILYTHRVSFGRTDPLFHTDIGFYVFQLPFLKFVVDWAFASIVIVLIVTAVAHYLNGGIRVQVPAAQRVTAQVKAHLSVLLGVLALLKAGGYWLQRYELNYSTRGVVDGAGYTDIHAQLPALRLLVIISIAAFVLFIVNIYLRGWILPIIAVGLWGFTSIVIGGAVPAFTQKFRVTPNQSERERPYIKRNIDATRRSMNLATVKVNNFRYNESLNAQGLLDNSATIRNVRLWDPQVLRKTYSQLQEIRRFYRFNDVDVDRYPVPVGGTREITQMMISARELDPGGVPSSWENTHLNFTHGYGAVLSPANAVTSNGLPSLLVRDLPPKGQPALRQPAIYYGENLGGYSIVNTKRQEIDFESDTGSVRTTYKGTGGVRLSSFVRRVAFALRFGDVNPLISGFITPRSRALYIRDIHERVRKVAPFLKFDADPYPVIDDGRLVWVQDAYTTTSRYPYAQRADTGRLADGSGLRTNFNYVRNSVKIITDAYNGDMTLYVIDKSDPIIRSYMKAFPRLFTTRAVPARLKSHLRYPEDLFRVQTNVFSLYHITDARDFYDKGDAWDIARDPGSGQVAAIRTTSGSTIAGATAASSGDDRMDPYYLLMRLPSEAKESFLILQPFTPASRELLSAFMVAKSDPDDYGKLEVFVMPRGRLPSGPTQVHAKINQETEISKEISLLNVSGSKVLNGNLLVIPVNRSLLYVRPLYVESADTQLPELKLVVVVFRDRAVARPTLQEALTVIFGNAPATREQPGTTTPGTTVPPGGQPTQPGVSPDVQNLLNGAIAAYQRAQQALANQDLAGYQKAVDEAQGLIRQARDRAGGATNPSPSTTTTTAPASA